MPPSRPSVIAFDVVETLVPLDALEWRFKEAGVPRVLMRRWSDHLLRDAFALAASGGYRPYRDLALSALADITGHQVAPSAAEAIVDAVADLEPRGDAAEALRRAAGSGARVIALDNAPEEAVRALLARTGCAELVERVVGAGSEGLWKPSPAPYRRAAEACLVPADRMALVTAHGWDAGGARSAGFSVAWSSHLEGRFPAVFGAPDATGRDPVGAVDALLS